MSNDVLLVIEQVESYLESFGHARLNAHCIVDLVDITKFLLNSFAKYRIPQKGFPLVNDGDIYRYDTLINLFMDYKEKHSLR